jgi:hypothetical protein
MYDDAGKSKLCKTVQAGCIYAEVTGLPDTQPSALKYIMRSEECKLYLP